MTEYEAMAVALREDRGLAEAVRRGDFIQSVDLHPAPAPISKAEEADGELRRHAEKLRKTDPALSHFDALVRASNEHPELVEAMR
jgi:hypothetical protein